ncbi:MAG: chromosomal replication initiator protein DnaA [Christensenellales bacterium]|nr:chromosomal replication initiator protein DnaA [Christensenellales bacterium]
MYFTPQQQAIWNSIIDSFREEINPHLFHSMISPLSLYAVTSDEVIVLYKDSFSLSLMMNRFHSKIEQVVQATFGPNYILKVYDAKDVGKIEETVSSSMLNSRYTFDNFVVGPSNNFAYAASVAVAEEPDGKAYNPLFIYGDVGLGKTHLMNAIGNYIRAGNPTANILFTTSEKFTNELIDALLKKRGTAAIRNRMRNVDVLMVDDVQFLSKTSVTQEEFFHTFNELHSHNKQIIVSSDRPPKELAAIEERLRSRFEWGLIVDIQKPDFETRMAILRRKADDEFIDIPYEVIEYIAAHFDRSIRELEGALNRLQAQSNLMGQPITIEMATETLSSLGRAQDSRVVTADLIIATVAKSYNITPEEILSRKRNREIALPRQIAMYICRELTSMSTTLIGQAFGGRDHTTVMHSCDKICEQMKDEFSFKKKVEELMDLVKNG